MFMLTRALVSSGTDMGFCQYQKRCSMGLCSELMRHGVITGQSWATGALLCLNRFDPVKGNYKATEYKGIINNCVFVTSLETKHISWLDDQVFVYIWPYKVSVYVIFAVYSVCYFSHLRASTTTTHKRATMNICSTYR